MSEQQVIRDMLADEENPLTRAHVHYEVCPQCMGEGSSSAYLGAYTSEEFYEMDEDWRDGYMAGAFDRTCETCGGNRVVLELNDDAPKEALAELREWWETEQMYAMERRMGA